MKHGALICMLDGTSLHGAVEVAITGSLAGSGREQTPEDGSQLYFESSDGERRGMIEINAVKMMYIGNGIGRSVQNGPRFFDRAAIPSSLWVRTSFADGEVVEGLIANVWSALSGALLELHLPDASSDKRQLLIPRTSIAELQVIATR